MSSEELDTHKRRLSILQIKAATLGINTPPEIIIEIEEIENKIKKLSNISESQYQDLRIVGVDLIDNHDDIIKFREVWLKERKEDTKEKGFFPIIDIKAINIGTQPVFLTNIIFDAKVINSTVDTSLYLSYPASWEYSIILDPNRKNEQINLRISQLILPKEGDRFIVIVGRHRRRLESVHYQINIEMLYNGIQSIELGSYLLNPPSPEFFTPEDSVVIKTLEQKTSQ